MLPRAVLITVIALGIAAAALAWGLQGFVVGKIGAPGCQSGYCPPHPETIHGR
jgi:hypothetical protein